MGNRHSKGFNVVVMILGFFIGLTQVVSAAPVMREQVRTAVETFISLRFPLALQSEEVRTKTAVGTSHSAVRGIESLLKDDGDTIGFVAHLSPSGYVLMRADDVCPPLKMYSESGNFADLPPELIEILRWELAEELRLFQIVEQKKTTLKRKFTDQWSFLLNPDPKDRLKERFTSSKLRSGGPLLSTRWNQGAPYNYYAPTASGGPDGRAYAGCVAAAFAQILRYHQWPAAISENYTYTDSSGSCTGTHSASDAGLGNYNWSNMPDAIYTSSSITQQQAVGQLIYHCGVTTHMDFEADGSGAYSGRVVTALRNLFAYTCSDYAYRSSYTDSQWYGKLDADIGNNEPAYYRFCRQTSTGATYCHAVVIDGTQNGNEIHVNMGWGGSSNAWYDMNNIDTGTRQYNYNHGAIFEIHPMSGNSASYLLWTK